MLPSSQAPAPLHETHRILQRFQESRRPSGWLLLAAVLVCLVAGCALIVDAVQNRLAERSVEVTLIEGKGGYCDVVGVQLMNPTTRRVSIDGWHVNDDITLHSQTIAPGATLTVWASDGVDDEANLYVHAEGVWRLQTSFSVRAANGELRFYRNCDPLWP